MSLPVFLPAAATRRGAVLTLALAASVSLTSWPAFAATSGLSLAEAQRHAVERSRQLPAADASISAAREMAVAAGRLPDPVLRAGIDNVPVSGPERFNLGSDFMTMRRVGVMQELTGSDKRRLRSALYQRAADKAAAEKVVATADVERDTALAWLELYYSGAMADLVGKEVEQAELALAAVEAGYRGGRSTQAEVLAARGALALLHDRASEAVRRVGAARIMLARWIGPELEPAVSGQPDISQVRLDPATLESTLGHHPELAVLERDEEIAKTEVRLAEANRHSDWSVEVAFQQRGQAYSNMLSVGVSLPLQWDRKNRQDRELAASLARAEQAGDERAESLRMHVAETRVMLDEWKSGRERLARYRSEILPLAASRTAATLAAYRGGKGTLPELLAARGAELDLGLQALQLEADIARLWARLNFLFPTNDARHPSAAPKDQQ
jgi:outer membrane protein TolC